MKKNFFIALIALLAMSFTGCKKTTAQLTWRVFTTPEATQEAKSVAERIDNCLSSYYKDLGKYKQSYTDGSAVFNSSVEIKGESYDQIKQKVDDATKLADEFLSSGEFNFGTLTQCRVLVTLFVDNCPAEILNKEYIIKE